MNPLGLRSSALRGGWTCVSGHGGGIAEPALLKTGPESTPMVLGRFLSLLKRPNDPRRLLEGKIQPGDSSLRSAGSEVAGSVVGNRKVTRENKMWEREAIHLRGWGVKFNIP